jgi:hypothetical protein
MNPVRCPYFDALVSNLIDAYARLGDRDVFCMLGGMEVPDEIEGIHLEMAEHRRTCPLCRKIDKERLVDDKAVRHTVKQGARPAQSA